MKRGQLLLSMDFGEGSMGQFFMMLFIKLFQLIRRIFSRSKNGPDEERS